MEKAQILSLLKANIGTTDNRFDKTLENFIEFKNLTSVADDELKLEQYTPDLKWQMAQAIGLANHEIAVAKKEWESNTTQIQQPTNPPAISPELQALLDKQSAELAELKGKLTGFETKATIDKIRSLAISEGAKLKANAALWEMAVKGIEIEDGATAETIIEKVKPAYEALQKSVFGNGGGSPYGNTEPDDPSAVTKATLDAYFADKPGFESK